MVLLDLWFSRLAPGFVTEPGIFRALHGFAQEAGELAIEGTFSVYFDARREPLLKYLFLGLAGRWEWAQILSSFTGLGVGHRPRCLDTRALGYWLTPGDLVLRGERGVEVWPIEDRLLYSPERDDPLVTDLLEILKLDRVPEVPTFERSQDLETRVGLTQVLTSHLYNVISDREVRRFNLLRPSQRTALLRVLGRVVLPEPIRWKSEWTGTRLSWNDLSAMDRDSWDRIDRLSREHRSDCAKRLKDEGDSAR
jgi:hypothetical protein